MPRSALEVAVRRRPGSIRVALVGEITPETTPVFITAVRTALRREPEQVDLDFAGVLLMHDDCLFAALNLHHRAQSQGCRLMLVRVPPHIRDRFDQTLLAELLTFDEPRMYRSAREV